ncbi:hypothetical protein FPP07_01840 [Staphylococcus aureus]|nr:hypothetical protein FPP07_01840 [Staphylococcus aureus]
MINVKSTENLNIVIPFIKQQPEPITLTKRLEDATDASSPLYPLLDLNRQDQKAILKNNFNMNFYMHRIKKNRSVPSVPQTVLSQKRHKFHQSLQYILKEVLTNKTQRGGTRIKKGVTAKFIDACFSIVCTSDNPDEIRLYNYEKGVWETSELPLQRFIYELCYTLGRVGRKTWKQL